MLKVHEAGPEVTQPFSAVEARLRDELLTQRRGLRKLEVLRAMRVEAKVERFDLADAGVR